jgi:PhnB protein
MTESFIGDGMTAITPYLYLDDTAAAIVFYEAVFGAEVEMRMPGEGPKIMHGEIRIHGAKIMMGDANPDWGMQSPSAYGGHAGSLYVYVPDMEAVHAKALELGAHEVQAPENQFYGDRTARFVDPFGHAWTVATHVEDVAPEEMNRRIQEWMGADA